MKTDICSHTIVKNGKPFIDSVLRQVLPFTNRSLVTISEKSDDGTLEILKQLQKEFKTKLFFDFENVEKPGELTGVRQKQLDRTYEDWVLFLDDDDYWPTESLSEMVGMLEEDVDAFAVNPIQLVNPDQQDGGWSGKWFTKWFRNAPDVHYRKPWPRDLIFKGDKMLYWKTNERVKQVESRFFHLSYIKEYSFRDEGWAQKFKNKKGKLTAIPPKYKPHVWPIYDQLNKF